MRNVTIRDIMDIAARKRGVEGWVPYKWEAAGDDSIVTGAVPTRTISKGKRKGRPDFTGAKRDVVVVTQAEVEQAAPHYERETGKCWDCKGSGQIQVGYSTATGAGKITSLKKPSLDDVRAFAEATPGAMKEAVGNRSGQIPAGDVRLTANIRGDLHLKLKIRAAEQRTTVGELIEQWIESWR